VRQFTLWKASRPRHFRSKPVENPGQVGLDLRHRNRDDPVVACSSQVVRSVRACGLRLSSSGTMSMTTRSAKERNR